MSACVKISECVWVCVHLPRGKTLTLFLISWSRSTSLLRATAWLRQGFNRRAWGKRNTRVTWTTHRLIWKGGRHTLYSMFCFINVTSESSGSILLAELFACGCNQETGRQFLWSLERGDRRRHRRTLRKHSYEQVCVAVCSSVYLSHAAARSTMVDTSCRAFSVRVEIASRSHSIMSVTTLWTKTHTQHHLTILSQQVLTSDWYSGCNFDPLKTNLVVSASASVQLPCRGTNQLLRKQEVKGLSRFSSQPSGLEENTLFIARVVLFFLTVNKCDEKIKSNIVS